MRDIPVSRLIPGNGVYAQVVVREEDWRDVLAVIEAVEALGPWPHIDYDYDEPVMTCSSCRCEWVQASYGDDAVVPHTDACSGVAIANALRRLEREVAG